MIEEGRKPDLNGGADLPQDRRAPMPFRADVPVRFSDRDMFGHVNHASYLIFCEEHRNKFFALWLQECGVNMLDAGFMVARVECDYKAALSRDVAEVRVDMTVGRIGRTSVQLMYELANETRRAASILYVLVLMDKAGHPRAIVDKERSLLSRFQVHE